VTNQLGLATIVAASTVASFTWRISRRNQDAAVEKTARAGHRRGWRRRPRDPSCRLGIRASRSSRAGASTSCGDNPAPRIASSRGRRLTRASRRRTPN